MALGDDLFAQAQSNYWQEIEYVLSAQSSADAAAVSADTPQARAAMYRKAQADLEVSVAAARNIGRLTDYAKGVDPSGYLTALQVLYQDPRFTPSAALERVRGYRDQIDVWRSSELSLSLSPNPRPDPIGGAQPGDAAGSVLGFVLLGGVAVAAGWALLRRR